MEPKRYIKVVSKEEKAKGMNFGGEKVWPPETGFRREGLAGNDTISCTHTHSSRVKGLNWNCARQSVISQRSIEECEAVRQGRDEIKLAGK